MHKQRINKTRSPAHPVLPGIRASPTGYWAGAERDLGCKNLGPQSVSSCRSKSLHDCDRRPVTILGSGPLMDDDGAMVCNDPAASAVGEQTTHDNKVGSRDICCRHYTRFPVAFGATPKHWLTPMKFTGAIHIAIAYYASKVKHARSTLDNSAGFSRHTTC